VETGTGMRCRSWNNPGDIIMDQREEARREARVREKAHQIWEREGRPRGMEKEHWDKASELVAQEEAHRDTLRPNPSHGPDDTAIHSRPVEPLSAPENLGEVPGLTDQGEQGPYPPGRQNYGNDDRHG